MRSHSIKDEREELVLFKARAVAAGVFALVLLLLIVARVFYLQVVKYDHYTQLSRENYRKMIPIPPVRGEIFDRNGVLLAGNHIKYVLEVVRDKASDLDGKLDTLARMFSLSEAELVKIRSKIRVNNRYQPIAIKENLSKEEIAVFSANRPRFLGFNIGVRMERYYPLGPVAGHVLGYVGRIDKQDMERIDVVQYKGSSHIGKTGLEKTYEKILHGKVGYQVVEVDVHGKHKKLLEEQRPIAGKDIYLSLDIIFQVKVEKMMRKHTGAVVALNPSNGEVLAMVSVPSYDPNMFVNGISHANYRALRENPDRPLYSRAFQGVYPPGSTIKPMVAIAGLNSGVTTPTRSVYGKGYFSVPGNRHHYRCWKKSGHGHVSMNRAIYQSCDVYFYDLAYRMGIDTFHEELSKFGFGSRTGIDLPHEKGALLPSSQWKNRRYKMPWYPGDTVNIGIGQGYWNATPLQLAHAVGIVSMRGKNPKPHLLRAVRKSRNDPLDLLPVQLKASVELKDPHYWDIAIQGMINVVHGAGGTARRSGAGAKYRFAGKTGTAQVFGIAQNKTYNASRLSKKLHDHSLFVSFAPAKEPEIALAVIAEHAGGGSKVAAPLARRILDAYFFPNADKEAEAKVEKAEAEAKKKAKLKMKKKNNE